MVDLAPAAVARCALCLTLLHQANTAVGFPPFATMMAPLWRRLSGAAVHKHCFREWALRDEFLEYYNSRILTLVSGPEGGVRLTPDGEYERVPP